MIDLNTCEFDAQRHVFFTPRLVIEDANMLAGALVWGFPSISGFVGFSVALERSQAIQALGLMITGVGVVHHDHQHHVYGDRYTKLLALKRVPLGRDGGAEGIVEEGRMRLEASLVFEINFKDGQQRNSDELKRIGQAIWQQILCMRICGGRPLPSPKGLQRPVFEPLATGAEGSDQETHARQMRRLARHLLPGFALVGRAGLLAQHTMAYKSANEGASSLDAFLDLCRWNHRSVEKNGKVSWETDQRKGWIVPIGIGFSAISDEFPAGKVKGARDDKTPLCVVEPVYSIGEFLAPHRIRSLESIVWRFDAQVFADHRIFISTNQHENVLLENQAPAHLQPDAQVS